MLILEYHYDDGQRPQTKLIKIRSEEEGLERAKGLKKEFGGTVFWVLYEKRVIACSPGFVT